MKGFIKIVYVQLFDACISFRVGSTDIVYQNIDLPVFFYSKSNQLFTTL